MTNFKAVAQDRIFPLILIVMLVGLAACMFLGYLVFLLVELNSFISQLIGVGYG